MIGLMSPQLLRSVRRITRRAVLAPLLLTASVGVTAAPAAAEPAGCVHEQRTASGAVDPSGLCVSYGYGRLPGAGDDAPFQNVVANAQGKVGMPVDYFVRSDIAQGIAAGTERPRGTYLLLFGGAFVCGNRFALREQARELARRGYIAMTPEYPLSASLLAYGNYQPNPGYSPESLAVKDGNSCNGFDDWIKTPAWKNVFLTRLKVFGFEPVLQESQLVLQTLIRRLKTDPSLGVDPKRIFAVGSSAGGSVALRLAFGGNRDQLADGTDPGDSTIAGALSVSGPACFPTSQRYTGRIIKSQIRPKDMAPCRLDADPSDPPTVTIMEPRGGKEDPLVYSSFMLSGCTAINAAAPGKCIYEDRPPSRGGYIADGEHAAISWTNWLRLFDELAAQGVGQP